MIAPPRSAATVLESLLNRRSMMKRTGALIVGMAAASHVAPGRTLAQTPVASGPDPAPPEARELEPTALDTWIAIEADGHVTAYFGKMDMGQGTDTGVAQFVADELDVAFERVTVVMGDTSLTVDQGGGSSASGIEQGSWPLRHAAAEARRVLVELASQELGVPADQLKVDDGVVSAQDDTGTSISYGELLGDQRFNVELEWNEKYGNGLDVVGLAEVKTADQFRVVGQPVPRSDVPAKVYATYTYIDKVSVPGMVHGRIIRPEVAGAMPVSFDETSVADIPNVQVVHRGGFIGLVADNEWHAVKAARQLKVTWSDAPPPFVPMESLYDYIRETPARHTNPGVTANVETDDGDVEAALAEAATVIEAEYEWPYMSHACLGPACAVADIREDGGTIWTGSQKPHKTRDGVAQLLGRDIESIRGIWVHGPGSYGRNEADDAAADAAILSEAVGKPVRVQYMRNEGHGWDPKGPAAVLTLRAGLDATNTVIAYDFHAKGFSAHDVQSNASDPGDIIAGQLLGMPRVEKDSFGVPEESYGFANKRLGWDVIDPMLWNASPLRTSHIRDPQGPQTTFASECFIDEIAFSLDVDPAEFRLQYLTDPRHIAAVEAVMKEAAWESRLSPNPEQDDPAVLKGRGISYAQRKNTVVAIVAEVEVNRETGRVWPRKFTVAHDCGLVVNPRSLRNTIEGAVMQAASRVLYEEVAFDENNVTSLDWSSYPILDITDTPEEFNIVMLDHPEEPPLGAGEPGTKPVAAAIANAIFDATGVRIRRTPFRPERVKAAMDANSQ